MTKIGIFFYQILSSVNLLIFTEFTYFTVIKLEFYIITAIKTVKNGAINLPNLDH
jgi:hypothetical protein